MSVQASLNGLVSSVLGTAGQIDTVTEKEVEKEFKEPEETETEKTIEDFKEDFDEADKAAIKSQQKKITTQNNQSTALEERINLLKSLNEEGIMSNTQLKKYEHKLKAGELE